MSNSSIVSSTCIYHHFLSLSLTVSLSSTKLLNFYLVVICCFKDLLNCFGCLYSFVKSVLVIVTPPFLHIMQGIFPNNTSQSFLTRLSKHMGSYFSILLHYFLLVVDLPLHFHVSVISCTVKGLIKTTKHKTMKFHNHLDKPLTPLLIRVNVSPMFFFFFVKVKVNFFTYVTWVYYMSTFGYLD